MKVRADMAELIRAGHSDTRIAHELGCHRATVHRARQVLQLPPSHRLGRLYAEALPTGQVRAYQPHRLPISPSQAAANRAALAAALRPVPAPADRKVAS
jgi:hypothetical protein